jgi:hypothetical protein
VHLRQRQAGGGAVINGSSFALLAIHTPPSDAAAEIAALGPVRPAAAPN